MDQQGGTEPLRQKVEALKVLGVHLQYNLGDISYNVYYQYIFNISVGRTREGGAGR